jgi:hypothetical protein
MTRLLLWLFLLAAAILVFQKLAGDSERPDTLRPTPGIDESLLPPTPPDPSGLDPRALPGVSVDASVVPDTAPDTDTDLDTETVPDTDTDLDTDTAPDTDLVPDTVPDTDTDLVPDTVPDTAPETETDLDPDTAPDVYRLRVETEPPGAVVEVRGDRRTSPATFELQAPGSVIRVRVRAPGFRARTERVRRALFVASEDGWTRSVRVTLRPQPRPRRRPRPPVASGVPDNPYRP